MAEKEKLTGVNYLAWAYLMQMILVYADLRDIVSKPPDNPNAAQCKASAKPMLLIVFDNFSTFLIPVVHICTTAADAWIMIWSILKGLPPRFMVIVTILRSSS